MPQRGTLFIFAGVPLVLAGVVAIKLTGMDASWALMALGAVVSCYGAIQVALSQQPVKLPPPQH